MQSQKNIRQWESDVQEFLKNHFDEFEGCRKVDKRGR